MTALAADRNTVNRDGKTFSDPMAAAVKIYAGSIVVLDASRDAKPGVVATTLIARGIAQDTVDNSTGIAGAKSVSTRKGTYKLNNDGTIARVDIGGIAYIVDDQTVADNNGTSTRSALGTIVDVGTDGVWVRID
ncbi:MAG: hypothetical protein OEW11_09560 [Nitrospirota bacterium]|nr:hypothetical protein [Nitrospirota bacterium]